MQASLHLRRRGARHQRSVGGAAACAYGRRNRLRLLVLGVDDRLQRR